LRAVGAVHYKPGMKRRRTLVVVGVVAMFLGWLAWKTLLTAKKSSPAVTQGAAG
jgi:hypothetical protein